jgi:hypothetical protein
MTVYTVYCVTGATDSSRVYDLCGVAMTKHGASVIVREQLEDAGAGNDPVHPSMSADNNYTFFGDRAKTRQTCPWGVFGDFIIEPTELRS